MNLAQSPYSRQVIGYPREGIADKQIRGRVRRCVLHRGEYIGCSLIRRRRRGPTPVGPFEETTDESERPEIIGNAPGAQRSRDGDPAGVSLRGAEPPLEEDWKA